MSDQMPPVSSGGGASPSPPDQNQTPREDQISNAVAFLAHPSIASATPESKREFLKNKGLTETEIEEAFRRVELNRERGQAAAAAAPNNQGALAPYPHLHAANANAENRPSSGLGGFLSGWVVPVVLAYGAYALGSQIWNFITSDGEKTPPAGGTSVSSPQNAARGEGGGTQGNTNVSGGGGSGLPPSGREKDSREKSSRKEKSKGTLAGRINSRSDSCGDDSERGGLSERGRVEADLLEEIRREQRTREAELHALIARQNHEIRELAGLVRGLLEEKRAGGGQANGTTTNEPVGGVSAALTAGEGEAKTGGNRSGVEGRADGSSMLGGTEQEGAGAKEKEEEKEKAEQQHQHSDPARPWLSATSYLPSHSAAAEAASSSSSSSAVPLGSLTEMPNSSSSSNGVPAPSSAACVAVRESFEDLLAECGEDGEAKRVLDLMALVLKNLRKDPKAERFRKFNASSAKFKERLGGKKSVPVLLRAIGFDKPPSSHSWVFSNDSLEPLDCALLLVAHAQQDLAVAVGAAKTNVADREGRKMAADIVNGSSSFSVPPPLPNGLSGEGAPQTEKALNGIASSSSSAPQQKTEEETGALSVDAAAAEEKELEKGGISPALPDGMSPPAPPTSTSTPTAPDVDGGAVGLPDTEN
uniref:Peroxisomal membrane protein PEX14 n=2 Tax=Chromera velia TaxID=505693 RepID=A0A2K8DNC6_9ALVE|nr:Peroxisomal membrane protein 14 [Chromera velia]|eukprot:Cvel_13320.t1-p1 / transcript=Cvel_13320.t1 / gene=Cvel_13320 / organism=Chromera_velia_CCMP2878 / gene_product=Peroxisomal membrane protein PEX14, putative / transcript_product=Peroxisomal membrane protein PEX14, putative / location=Cvel_scaffold904:21890-27450(+) / protein_length=644 / sequence_SO=supercontig / SO=protein_coding / is_pseudo=false